MSMTEQTYTTLEREASAELIEKKSVFIGHAKHTADDSEALEFIERIRSEHADATHNVFAYYLRGGAMARYSDDGEPQGTSGPPVLDVIKKSGCDDCTVVVTRYFGGTLLGAGGLVRAYSAAAKRALDAAHIVTFVKYFAYTLNVDYGDYSKLTFELERADAIIDSSDFSDKVSVGFALEASRADAVIGRIRELSGGRLIPTVLGERFDCKISK